MGDAEAPAFKPRLVFGGRYRIVCLFGGGERKRTYLAEETIVPQRAALALIRPRMPMPSRRMPKSGNVPDGKVRTLLKRTIQLGK